jgi:acyl carrier protein
MSDVQAEVVRTLTEVVGEDFLLDVEIGPETTLNADLGLESIEFVRLLEKLRLRYVEADFPGFLAGLGVDELAGLTVGDLVGHIVSQRDSPTREVAP